MVYRLVYLSSKGPQLISLADTIDELKATAKLDSRLHTRPPELYHYEPNTKGWQLFDREEVRQIDAANLRAHGTSV